MTNSVPFPTPTSKITRHPSSQQLPNHAKPKPSRGRCQRQQHDHQRRRGWQHGRLDGRKRRRAGRQRDLEPPPPVHQRPPRLFGRFDPDRGRRPWQPVHAGQRGGVQPPWPAAVAGSAVWGYRGLCLGRHHGGRRGGWGELARGRRCDGGAGVLTVCGVMEGWLAGLVQRDRSFFLWASLLAFSLRTPACAGVAVASPSFSRGVPHIPYLNKSSWRASPIRRFGLVGSSHQLFREASRAENVSPNPLELYTVFAGRVFEVVVAASLSEEGAAVGVGVIDLTTRNRRIFWSRWSKSRTQRRSETSAAPCSSTDCSRARTCTCAAWRLR